MSTPGKIGRYEINGEIGRGGMAVIFSAHDPFSGREVAIKILPAEFGNNAELRARFEREMKAVASLEHECIVTVYDFGEHEHQPYFVMKYMKGGSLADRLRNGLLSLEDAILIISRVASALDYAHDEGIIHRDLKPGNIMFDDHGNAFLADFGIAKITESGATLTHGAIVGTPAYMSPEQGSGDPNIDRSSDIYSLGVILFEMLTGRVPFRAEAPMAQVMMHITEPVPNILDFNPDLPDDIQVIIATAMAKRKFVRYSKASQLAQALISVYEGNGLPDFAELADGQTNGEKTSTPSPGGKGGGPISKPLTPPKGTAGISQGRPLTPPGATRMASTPARGTRHAQTPPRNVYSPDYETISATGNPEPELEGTGARKISIGLVLGIGLLFGLLALISMFALNQPFRNYMLSYVGFPNPTPTKELFPTATEELLIVLPASENTPTIQNSPTPEDTATPTEIAVIVEEASPTPDYSPTPTPLTIGGADKVAFVKDNDIWVSNLDASEMIRLTNTGGSKSGLNWTPDGGSVTFISGLCVQMVDINTGVVSTIVCFNWANSLSSFKISPNGEQIAISSSDGLFILPYDLDALRSIDRQDELMTAERCLYYNERETKTVQWSKDGSFLAVVTVVSEAGRPTDLIYVMDVSRCGTRPSRVDEFPGVRFTIKGYANDPIIQSFGWDGNVLVAMNINKLNGFGDVYLYNMSSYNATTIAPLGGTTCCFRDFTWTPDGQFLMFVFQDINFANKNYLYLVPYGRIGTGEKFTPIPFPEDFFIERRERIQPVLRPAK
jgi:serine/threonine protein kinase